MGGAIENCSNGCQARLDDGRSSIHRNEEPHGELSAGFERCRMLNQRNVSGRSKEKAQKTLQEPQLIAGPLHLLVSNMQFFKTTEWSRHLVIKMPPEANRPALAPPGARSGDRHRLQAWDDRAGHPAFAST